MKRTIKLKESVDKASDSNYKEFNEQIAKLIEDEQEAIQGYEDAMKILLDDMTDNQNSEIREIMTHIINEEKEHIEELKELKKNIETTSDK